MAAFIAKQMVGNQLSAVKGKILFNFLSLSSLLFSFLLFSPSFISVPWIVWIFFLFFLSKFDFERLSNWISIISKLKKKILSSFSYNTLRHGRWRIHDARREGENGTIRTGKIGSIAGSRRASHREASQNGRGTRRHATRYSWQGKKKPENIHNLLCTVLL